MGVATQYAAESAPPPPSHVLMIMRQAYFPTDTYFQDFVFVTMSVSQRNYERHIREICWVTLGLLVLMMKHASLFAQGGCWVYHNHKLGMGGLDELRATYVA